jgi:hypothetical protein
MTHRPVRPSSTGSLPPDRGLTGELRELLERTAPVSLSAEQVLAVLGPLEGLFPGRGLPRGAVVEVTGGVGVTSVMLALTAGASRSGSWVAYVGMPELGWQAAEEQGVDLARVVAVPHPASRLAMVLGALIDGTDLIVCGPALGPTPAQLRNLRARARERGAVLLGLSGGAGSSLRGVHRGGRGGWGSADLAIEVEATRWSGIETGSGRLQAREIEVAVGGRGRFARRRAVRVAIDASGALRSLHEVSRHEVAPRVSAPEPVTTTLGQVG